MPTEILVINSSAEKNCLLTSAFKELEQRQFAFSIWSSRPAMINQFKKNRWPAKRIFLGPDLKNGRKILLFIALLPFIQLKSFFSLAGLKIKARLNLIICLNLNEKIILTAPAKLLGLKTVWLEAPDMNYRRTNKLLLGLLKINHRFAKIIVFNNYAKQRLAGLGFKNDNLNLVPPGARASQYQENIFNKLAALSQANFHRKYFTVGAIAELSQKQKIEAVFQAVKICLPVIPNLQLIIIGEGEARKNLLWLSKKMGIENLVWLVGEQEQLKRWLDSFDVFLALSDEAKLDDYGHVLEAMAAGLPVIGQRNAGLEDLVAENKNGCLIQGDNSEALARQIIKLYQDKKLRFSLGRNGCERVNRFFTLNQMVAALEKNLIT